MPTRKRSPRRAEPAPLDAVLPELRKRVAAGKYNFDVCPTAKKRDGPYHRDDVVAALLATRGNLAEMGLLLNRRRANLKAHIDAQPELRDLLADTRDDLLDRLETLIANQALGGDTTAITFLLRTLGKGRGYTTRVEQTGEDGAPVRVLAARLAADLDPQQAADLYAQMRGDCG